MPRSARSQESVRQMATGLLNRREAVEPGITAQLRADAHSTVGSRSDLVIQHDQEHADSSTCSIAAAYLRDTKPPRIVLTSTASYRRELFSVLHEFAHFLIDQDDILADLLWQEPDQGGALEEDICDAFAALILVGDNLVDSVLDADGVTANAVLRLYRASEGSREACAVAMAQRLGSPGYVVIAAADDDQEIGVIARFAARSGNVFPIARNTPQPGTILVEANRRGRARGQDQLWYPSGARTEVMHVDVVADQGYLFAVVVTDRPAWGGLSVRDPTSGGYDTTWCEHCGSDFRPDGAACRACGEHTCPTCRRCACPAGAPPQAKLCPECFQERPRHLFHSDICDVCAD